MVLVPLKNEIIHIDAIIVLYEKCVLCVRECVYFLHICVWV